MNKIDIHLAALHQAVTEASLEDCPALIGELERLKAEAWVRMTKPANGSHPEDQEECYTIPEVASLLKISPYRAYELARQGKLPCTRIGKLVRVSASQLAEFRQRMNGKKVS